VSDDCVDDFVGTAGVGEQLGEHRTKGDQDAHTGCGGAEAVTERIEHIASVLPRDDAHGQGPEDQREERMQLGDGDQHDDEGDACQRGQHQLTSRQQPVGAAWCLPRGSRLPGSSLLLFGCARGR
jgi:hypothetical protein